MTFSSSHFSHQYKNSAVVLSLSLKTFSANSTQHANNTDIALQNVPSNEKIVHLLIHYIT